MQLNSARLLDSTAPVEGSFVDLEGERFYRIANYDRMPPFFMSVVSASNHWMFISSSGGLTAGRWEADHALFPYFAEDRIHDDSHVTGPRTAVRVRTDAGTMLWDPFSPVAPRVYDISRNLYKHEYGNALVFEEINRTLGLTFRYGWSLSGEFGFVKRASIENHGTAIASVEILDGLQNVLPSRVDEAFQVRYSALGDAYKDSQLHAPDGLATFALSSVPGDSTDPMESLRANVVWSTVDPGRPRLLSSRQLERFRAGESIEPETRMLGVRGAYFVEQELALAPGASEEWLIVADLDHGIGQVTALRRKLRDSGDPHGLVMRNVHRGTAELAAIVAAADGLQATGDELGSAHHFANVLFNVMRGGVFETGYTIPMHDLKSYLKAFNRELREAHREFLDGLGSEMERHELLAAVDAREDVDLSRLVAEYLPLSFSRRHGDPSRPWNRFSIRVRDLDGSRLLAYQGNWRDIFQNWEALCLSFPEYLEGILAKFVNTTTADGYNPYRVTQDGYDWEKPDPDEPWANLGYWGDHQIIYLLKFLEWSRAHHPEKLRSMLHRRDFVYADVPYDVKPYAELLENPRHAIVYNTERERRIEERVEATGFDGRYLRNASGEICRATLTEKLLVPLLTKVATLAPGAGFWMNTQRPEWNDANNALAGYGASMVTLCYARRYVAFCLEAFHDQGSGDAVSPTRRLSEEVADWLIGTLGVLESHRYILKGDAVSDSQRKAVMDGLGELASDYRQSVYTRGLSGRTVAVDRGQLEAFLETTLAWLDHSIALSRRDDGLYHAYNVLDIRDDGVGVVHMYGMLEGQVAALSSGALDGETSVSVLKALRESAMYREDQHSYMLYPNRVLPGFMEKNIIPEERAAGSRLISRLLAEGNRELVERDVEGRVHFNPDFHNGGDVTAALERLRSAGYGELVDEEGEDVRGIFEDIFRHHSFTGRSGTFYGYEGLGSIYWHMVSKLLLAAQETAREAGAAGDSSFGALAEAYYDVRKGIGFNKTPEVYGAFPTDPYSHTPSQSGARQPGMTGQVKEEVITRRMELALDVRDGCIVFDPLLLRAEEFLTEPTEWSWYDVNGRARTTPLEAGTLGFTCCQVPVVLWRGDGPRIRVVLDDGEVVTPGGDTVDAELSGEIFRRTGRVARIEVTLQPGL
jgi:hypothetical protein